MSMKFLSSRFWGIVDSLVAGWILFAFGSSASVFSIIGIIFDLPQSVLLLILTTGQVIIILAWLWILRRMFLIKSRMLKKGLDIVSATYGVDGHMVDVTRNLISKILDGKRETFVGNNLTDGDDPVPGVKKKLKVVYFYNGKESSKEFLEGETLSIEVLS